jgi:hypothetical protein
MSFENSSRDLTLGRGCFLNCLKLRHMHLRTGVTVVGDRCFRNCTSLTHPEFRLGEQTKCLGKHAFDGCASLTDIVIPANVEKIDYGCFENCDALKTVSFGPGSKLTYIGVLAFSYRVAFGNLRAGGRWTAISGGLEWRCPAGRRSKPRSSALRPRSLKRPEGLRRPAASTRKQEGSIAGNYLP